MSSLDYFLVAATVCLITFTVFGSILIYHTIQAVQSLKRVIDDIEDTTHDVQTIKNTIKVGSLALLSRLLNFTRGRE
jgi:hypothetical protein